MATIMGLEKGLEGALKGGLQAVFYERYVETLRGDRRVMGPHMDIYFDPAQAISRRRLETVRLVVNAYLGPCRSVIRRKRLVRDARFPGRPLRCVTAVLREG